MARHDTWMPLYVGDYLADTMHLTTRQHGAYLLLLMHAWRNGGRLPSIEQWHGIARLPESQWEKDAPAVMAFFDFDERGWTHSRVEKEYKKAAELTDDRSKAGSKGAAKRWQRHKQTDGPSPSPSSVAKATDADAASVVFNQGLAWLMKSTGKPEGNCRAQLGKWRKEIGDEGLIAVLGRGQREAPIDAMSWLEKAVAAHGTQPRKPWEKPPADGLPPSEPWEQRMRGYKPGGFWKPNDWGKRPEEPGTRVPPSILATWRQGATQ